MKKITILSSVVFATSLNAFASVYNGDKVYDAISGYNASSTHFYAVADGEEVTGKLIINADNYVYNFSLFKNGKVGTSNATADGKGVKDASYNAIEITGTGSGSAILFNACSAIDDSTQNSTVYGNIVYNLSGNRIASLSTSTSSYLLGVGYKATADTTGTGHVDVYGNLTMNLGREGGNITTFGYGSVYGVQNATVHGNLSMSIYSGVVKSVALLVGANAEVKGNVDLYIGKGVAITGMTGNLNTSKVGGNVNITYEGMKSTSFVCAGNLNVGGDMNILVKDSNVTGVMGVYNSANSSPHVDGNLTITLAGSTVIGSTVLSSGALDGMVSGKRILKFESFSGTIDSAPTYFDVIKVSADSVVDFGKAFTVETLEVAYAKGSAANISLTSGTSIAELQIFADFDLTGVESVMLSSIFKDTTILEEALANAQISITDSNNVTYDASLDIETNSLIITSIPEPATCAAIAGLLALAFAAYRRRK